MGAFSSQSVRARMAAPSHVAKVPLRKRTALCAGALPARSLRARGFGLGEALILLGALMTVAFALALFLPSESRP